MMGIYDYSETGQEFVFRHPKEGLALYGQGTLPGDIRQARRALRHIVLQGITRLLRCQWKI